MELHQVLKLKVFQKTLIVEWKTSHRISEHLYKHMADKELWFRIYINLDCINAKTEGNKQPNVINWQKVLDQQKCGK